MFYISHIAPDKDILSKAYIAPLAHTTSKKFKMFSRATLTLACSIFTEIK